MMNIKYIMIFVLLISVVVIIPIVSAVDISDTFQINVVSNYSKPCFYNNSYCSDSAKCNFTIYYPDDAILVENIQGTNNYYNHNISFTPDVFGIYTADVICQDNGYWGSETFYFEVTPYGEQMTTGKSILQMTFLVLLVFLFVLSLYTIPKLPSGNDTDDYGRLISINQLKYLKPVMFGIAWALLLGIMLLSSGIAYSYLQNDAFGDLLFVLWRIMFYMTLPAIVICFLYMFVSIFKDKEVKSMLERGADMRGMP